jgi:SAM-dependent methyltransferase
VVEDDRAGQSGYLLDNRQTEAGRRLDLLAELFDPVTFRHCAALGLAAGWHCWEAGAGGPGVPARLAALVGPGGRVLATDLDVTWLPAEGATYEVLRHDLRTDPVPPGGFDLVHARLVLVHLPERAAVLAALAGALKPGGWLLVEDADPALQPLACPDEAGEAERLANRLRRGFRTLLAERGADLAFGRTLPRLMRATGLSHVGAEGSFPYGSPAGRALEAATVRQIGAEMVTRGLASEEDLGEHLANLAAGRVDVTTAPMISAWGQRPVTPGRPPAGRGPA